MNPQATIKDAWIEIQFRYHKWKADRVDPIAACKHLAKATRLVPFRNSRMSAAVDEVIRGIKS